MCAPPSQFTRSGAVNPQTPVTRGLCRGPGDARAAGPGEPRRWLAASLQGAQRRGAVEGQLHPRTEILVVLQEVVFFQEIRPPVQILRGALWP